MGGGVLKTQKSTNGSNNNFIYVHITVQVQNWVLCEVPNSLVKSSKLRVYFGLGLRWLGPVTSRTARSEIGYKIGAMSCVLYII